MIKWIQNKHARFRDLKLTDLESYEYLLGAFQGDGSSSKGGETSYTIHNQNKGYIKAIKKLLKKAFFGCKPKSHNTANVVVVRIHSVKLLPFFRAFKVDGVWNLPEIKHPKSYIAGVIDTDGTIGIKGGRAYCTITQKHKHNILLIAKILDSLKINYKLTLDYKYTNYLGNFERSEIKIAHRDNVSMLLDFPFRNPERQSKIERIKVIYSNSPRKRPDGELESLILSFLDSPKTLKELMNLTKCTSGNISYKLLRMNTIKRVKIGRKYSYSKI